MDCKQIETQQRQIQWANLAQYIKTNGIPNTKREWWRSNFPWHVASKDRCAACGDLGVITADHVKTGDCNMVLMAVFDNMDAAKAAYKKAYDAQRTVDVEIPPAKPIIHNFKRHPEVDAYTDAMDKELDACVRQHNKQQRFAASAGMTNPVSSGSPLPKCAMCPSEIKHANPHAVFCSSMCAADAAMAATARMGATDRALRFLAGLNLQDHSVAEQRECLSIVHELLAVLKPKKAMK